MIHLTVARPAEARPLVQRYGLTGQDGTPFPLYRGDDIVLVVSGPGKIAAAAAAGWLHPVAGGRPDGAWLSIGLAGHAELEVGRGLLVHKVVDAGSGESWYPSMVLEHPVPTNTVITVEHLEGDYDGEVLYDREASGFFAAASRFATAELVQAFRIVADNHSATLGESFAPEVVEDLVESKLQLLDGFIEELLDLSREARGAAAETPLTGAEPLLHGKEQVVP